MNHDGARKTNFNVNHTQAKMSANGRRIKGSKASHHCDERQRRKNLLILFLGESCHFV